MEGEAILWPIVWVNTRRNMANTIEPAAMVFPVSLIRRTRDQRPNPLLGVNRQTRNIVFDQRRGYYISLPVYFYPDSPPPTEPHNGRFVDHVIIHLHRDAVVFDHEGRYNPHRASPYGGLSLEVWPFAERTPVAIHLLEGSLPALQSIANRIRIAMPPYGPDPTMLKRAVPQTGFYFRHVVLRTAFDFHIDSEPAFTHPWIVVHLCEHRENLRAHHFDLLMPCGDPDNPFTGSVPMGPEPFQFQAKHTGYYPILYDAGTLGNEPALRPGTNCTCLSWPKDQFVFYNVGPQIVHLVERLVWAYV